MNTYFTAHDIGYGFSYLYEQAKKRFAKKNKRESLKNLQKANQKLAESSKASDIPQIAEKPRE